MVLFEAVFLSFAVFVLVSGFISQARGAPYVPLPKKSIKGILAFADLKGDGRFYDLGCGDGRVLIEAVKGFGIKKAIGYEISPWPYFKGRFLVRSNGLKEKITILKKDFLEADFKQADVVFIYLYPKIVQKLVPKFKEELYYGSKIISVSFPIQEPENFNLRLIKTGKIDKFNTFLYQKV
ncbi:MAG: hypothetical protein AAB469_01240 [Patescibacteria group bacterium]